MQENSILVNKLLEYTERAYSEQDFLKFTEFLDEHQQSVAISLYKNRYFENFVLFGGYPAAERKILCIYSENEPNGFPIKVLKILFNNKEYLSHRNILGALMNLNIKRSLIGDICIFNDYAYLICNNIAAEIVLVELKSVGKSGIKIEEVSINDFDFTPETKEETHIISSNRLDSIVSALIKSSRNKASELISASLVFVNGEVIKNDSKKISENSKLSIRGYGKFEILDMSQRTGRDRIKLVIKKFI